MSAYLLAEEEALGGEDSKAIRRRALRCTVCAGCLADFSLLLLVQSTELEHEPLGRGHTALFPNETTPGLTHYQLREHRKQKTLACPTVEAMTYFESPEVYAKKI